MQALRQKACSQRGASITFALLLFLVCAIISSIVIVAATAVGGRASRMAEMDQRYYAVNSAAELLRDVLEAPTVTITTGTTAVSTVRLDKEPVSPATQTPIPMTVTYDDGAGTPTDITDETGSLVVAAALLSEGQTATLPQEALLECADMPFLNVTLTPVPSDDRGKLTLDVSNTDTSRGAYTLRLTFKANRTQSADSRTTYGTPVLADGQYTMEKTEVNTTTTVIRWKMIDLQTVTAAMPTANP